MVSLEKFLKRFDSHVLGVVFVAGVLMGAAALAFAQDPMGYFESGRQFAFPASCVNGSVQPLFSPGAHELILNEVSAARQSIDIELYQFSFAELKLALADAAKRGVVVRVILEPTVTSNFDTAEYLSKNRVLVRWATREFTRTHSKTAVFDGKKVLVGSINWSLHAMKLNRESAVIVDDAKVAVEFKKVFEADWKKALVSKVGISGNSNETDE